MERTSDRTDAAPLAPQIILSFDVEEHYRIEAAAGLALDAMRQAEYDRRAETATRWLLDQLGALDIRATFFVVGQLARKRPALVRAICRAGHELASHGWDHQRVHRMAPAGFAADVRQSRDALEQVIGAPVVGYRAPTFSITRATAWALDVLAEQGFRYDSSVYPVQHDRYGVPRAPRWPFRARGPRHAILELPPLTLRCLGVNLPVGGGGYFRLLPLFPLERALRQAARDGQPPVAMLYFHPWEFDPNQPRLPLGRLGRWRTYAGIGRSRRRLQLLLARYRFARAIDVVDRLEQDGADLPAFALAPAAAPTPAAAVTLCAEPT
jgi:polysaccharide deacetylase family protein (PEP-CTERM system associated)